MAAHRPARRLAAAAAAPALGAFVGVWAVARRPEATLAMAALVGVALAALACGAALRRGALAAGGAGLLAAAFVVGEVGRPMSLLATTAAAVLVLAALELAFDAADAGGLADPGMARRRRSELAVVLAGGFAAALVVATAALARAGAGLWLLAVGALAAVGLVAAIARAMSITPGDPQSTEPPRRDHWSPLSGPPRP